MADIQKYISPETAPFFSIQEINILNSWIERGGSNLPPSVAENFLTLFCEGRSVDEIQKLNNKYPLAQILYARYAYKWDEKLVNYVEHQSKILPMRLKAAQMKAINHILDKLAVTDMYFKKQMEIYIQNPIPSNLPSNLIASSSEYKEVVETINSIMKVGTSLTGETAQAGGNSVTVVVNNKKESTEVIIDSKHSDILKALDGSVRDV